MKAVLSNRIYLEATKEYIEFLRKTLTYRIPAKAKGYPEEVIRNLFIVKPGLVSIPSGREDLIPEGYDIVDKRTFNPAQFPPFEGKLRDSQAAIHDDIDDSAIINAWVSFGKTYTALAIAGKFQQKTLVITHTIALRTQWEKEIRSMYGIEPGVIGSGKFNIKPSIVVSNIQSLYKHIDKIYKEFGLVILDEMHHVSSPTFTRVLDKMTARYKIGLSGTIKRKDGKHIVFKDFFGSKLYQPAAENFMEPVVHIFKSNSELSDTIADWANKINKLLLSKGYQKEIAFIAANYAAIGHKVLVVADRVEFLQRSADLCEDKAICVTGAVAYEDRDDLIDKVKSGDKSILFGTQSIFSEGISVNELSCLILATPINNEPLLTQLVGRVIREVEGKKQPVIVDINLKGKQAKRQDNTRLGFYLDRGWKIEYFE